MQPLIKLNSTLIKLNSILIILTFFSLLSCNFSDGEQIFNPDVLEDTEDYVNQDSSFRVTLVEPSHGSVAGGEAITIRGFGFEDGSIIRFGEHMADPDNTVFIAPNRMLCPAPAGNIGSVNVSVTRPDSKVAVLSNAYSYDRFTVEPSSGSMSGGTLIRIISPLSDFSVGDQVFLGDKLIQGLTIVSPSFAVGTTPPNSPQSVNLKVKKSDGTEIIVQDAFLYYDSTDPAYGGMSGEPIDGNITVTVLNSYGHTAIENAFVMLNANPQNNPFTGRTDPAGQITFSSPELKGMQMLTVAAEGFENTSIIGFDSDEITVFLTPQVPPSSGGGIPGVPTTLYSHIVGSVDFKIAEFKYGCTWDHMIEPAPSGFIRTVKIIQSLFSYTIASPEVYEIYETNDCVDGIGYPFELTVYPGAFALFAIAGYKSDDGKTFIPQAFGVVRNIIIGADETQNVKLDIEYIMNQSVNVTLLNAPPLDAETGPLSYNVKLVTDLGSDGYLVFNDSAFNGTDLSNPIPFTNQVSLSGKLADASYTVFAEAQNNGSYPFSKVFIKDFTSNDIVIDSFLGIPTPISPVNDASSFNDRFSFEASNPITPSFHIIKINTFPDSDPYWKIYLNGELNQFTLPDLDSIEQVPHKPAGTMYWHIQSVLIPEMNFNKFTYRYLSSRYWISNSADGSAFHF